MSRSDACDTRASPRLQYRQRALPALLLLWVSIGPAAAAAAETRGEVRLIAELDEPRGYCLDIVGYQTRAEPAKGIHAHTCYSYRGYLATDQAFDAAALAEGILRMPDWAACVTAATTEGARRVTLEPCDGQTGQQFDFAPTGEISPRAAPSLCLAVHDASGRPGGGGTPPHLIRSLLIEPCTSERTRFQRWRVRSNAR